jgi:hypothetical protein
MRADDAAPVIALAVDGGDSCAMAGEAARRLSAFRVSVVDIRTGEPGSGCDVLVVGLRGGSLGTLEWALLHWTDLGRPELVFVSADVTGDPFARGLVAAGVRYVLGQDEAVDWLCVHAPALTAFTRARRALLAAREQLPEVPRPAAGDAGAEPLGLFQAEQRFRAAYIQTLLARSRSRREAAQKARVAYRTFCHILEKLGISSRKFNRQRLAIANDPSLALPIDDPPRQHDRRETSAKHSKFRSD